MNKIASRLRELRQHSNLTLKEVAERLGVTIRSICRYEDGSREPSVDLIIMFCKLYDCTSDYLIGLTDY